MNRMNRGQTTVTENRDIGFVKPCQAGAVSPGLTFTIQ